MSSQLTLTKSSNLQQIPTELWICIATYMSSLRDFMNLWLNCSSLRRLYPNHHSAFWDALLKGFLESRGANLNSILLRTSTSLSFMLSSAKIDRSTSSNKDIAAPPPSCTSFQQLSTFFISRKCSRSGCLQLYEEWQNHSMACLYHPGKMKAGLYLSCCRAASFQSPGCTPALHDGSFQSMVRLLSSSKETTSSTKQPSVVSILPSLAAVDSSSQQTSRTAAPSSSLISLPPINS